MMSKKAREAAKEDATASDPLLELVKYVKLHPVLEAVVCLAIPNSGTPKADQIQQLVMLCSGKPILARALAEAFNVVIVVLRLWKVDVYISNLVYTLFLSKWWTTLRVDNRMPDFDNIMAYVRKEKPAQGGIAVNPAQSKDSYWSAPNFDYCPQGVFSFRQDFAFISVDTRFEKARDRKDHRDTIVVTVIRIRPQEALQAFLKRCKDSAESDLKPKDVEFISHYTLNTQSGKGGCLRWKTKNIRARSMDTVYLPDERKNRTLKEIKRFWSPKWEAEMRVINRAYRRNYLFHGKPGTGKNSMAQAIATEFDVPIATLSLASPSLDDDNINDLLHSFPNRGVLLLEDVDCCHDSRHTRTSQEKISNVSHSALLNALDGVGAAEGRLLIMTTNFPERLDEALIRPARCDVWIEFGCMTSTDALRQYLKIYLRQYYLDENTWGISRKTIAAEIFSREKAQEIADEIQNSPDSLKENMLAEENAPSLANAEKITKMAHYFASRIKDDVLTPAQIEGFLIDDDRFECPFTAIKKIEAFVEENGSTQSPEAVAQDVTAETEPAGPVTVDVKASAA